MDMKVTRFIWNEIKYLLYLINHMVCKIYTCYHIEVKSGKDVRGNWQKRVSRKSTWSAPKSWEDGCIFLELWSFPSTNYADLLIDQVVSSNKKKKIEFSQLEVLAANWKERDQDIFSPLLCLVLQFWCYCHGCAMLAVLHLYSLVIFWVWIKSLQN